MIEVGVVKAVDITPRGAGVPSFLPFFSFVHLLPYLFLFFTFSLFIFWFALPIFFFCLYIRFLPV